MASGAARQPGGAPVAYAAAKAGIVNFTQQAAVQVGPANVRVNCIAPAAVLTDAMAVSVPEERQRQLVAAYPLGRLGRPDDVAAAALFLASSASSWITGVTLDVAGGQIIR
jgi:3-oxoacyl-[acyl-carrier protein] reductase